MKTVWLQSLIFAPAHYYSNNSTSRVQTTCFYGRGWLSTFRRSYRSKFGAIRMKALIQRPLLALLAYSRLARVRNRPAIPSINWTVKNVIFSSLFPNLVLLCLTLFLSFHGSSPLKSFLDRCYSSGFNFELGFANLKVQMEVVSWQAALLNPFYKFNRW